MQIAAGQALADRLRAQGFDIAAAWWMKTSEEGIWFLYFASKAVKDKGIGPAYRDVRTAMRGIEQIWVGSFDVKLVAPDNPIAVDVLELLRLYPGRYPIRSGRKQLGKVAIEDSYIYPPPAPSQATGGGASAPAAAPKA